MPFGIGLQLILDLSIKNQDQACQHHPVGWTMRQTGIQYMDFSENPNLPKQALFDAMPASFTRC
ncbi:hypothetical protein DSCO28_30970 [Desulfosarcina ovata subsp. sediminis]|uniref:Uncharacterized protein n=2 Tax=Desulfosarcina ovata TaxID=83564 RepID=A0A5K7ZN22_9BACT|nr:hypothetical protein DSCO28_30970 [Desulfosarcina ovata subsp. sediminis]